MNAWEQIQKTLDYIELHLDEEISIDELSELAALSKFYYQRLFTRLVKKPVAEYIKLRRMAKATELLLQEDKRILDIAVELGFTSNEHFTRVFKQTFGMTPDAYRKEPVALNRMTKPELSLGYVLVDEGVPLITEGIVLEVNRITQNTDEYYMGLEKCMPIEFISGLGTDSGVDPLDELWNQFHQNKSEMKGIDEAGEEVGVTYSSDKEGFFTYYAGTRDSKDTKIEGYHSWIMPAGEYIVCSFEAENFEALVMDALYKAQQYLYSVWLPGHKIVTEPFCVERYARHSADTTQMEVMLKIVK